MNAKIKAGIHSDLEKNTIMNKTRLIGLIIMIIGIVIHSKLENDLTDFITGFLLAAGIIILVSGKTIFNKRNRKRTT